MLPSPSWRYDAEVQSSGGKSEQPKDDSCVEVIVVTNIVGMSGMTHSGIIYTPEELRKEDLGKNIKMKGRESEYKLINQLNCMLARISLFSFLMNLENHRKLLTKVFNEVYVAHDNMSNKFRGIINITTNNYLTFTNEENSAKGKKA
ncbi:hypothetical protein CR513_34061, partial [Mucuna pruriens]